MLKKYISPQMTKLGSLYSLTNENMMEPYSDGSMMMAMQGNGVPG
jgi:hypothetical protein